MGGKSSSSSSSNTTTQTQNLNLQAESVGVSIAGNEGDVTLTDYDTVSAAGEFALKALDIIATTSVGNTQAAVDAATKSQTKAIDFALAAQQPDGGATVQIVKWVALAAAVAFGVRGLKR